MKNRLSFSSVQMYLESSKKYYLHYIAKIRPEQTKSAFIFGHALDCAFNSLLKERNLDKALRIFLYRMKNAIINGKRVKVQDSNLVKYTKNDLDIELIEYYQVITHSNLPWYSLCLKGKLLIETYYNQVLPHIKKTISVQKPISLKNEEGDSISGLLDAIVEWNDGKVYLIDNKSSTVKYDKDSVKTSGQLALYHYLVREDIKLDGCGFIVLDKNIKKNKICSICETTKESSHKTCNVDVNGKRCNGQWKMTAPSVNVDFIFDTIEEQDEDKMLVDFDKVNTAIANEEFSCDPYTCGSKFGPCPYREYCKTGDMTGLIQLSKREKKK